MVVCNCRTLFYRHFMSILRSVVLVLLACLFCFSGPVESARAFQFQQVPANSIQQRYKKQSVRIPMRDGKTLYTTIYAPRDKSKQYPILLKRIPTVFGPTTTTSIPVALGRRGIWNLMATFSYIRMFAGGGCPRVNTTICVPTFLETIPIKSTRVLIPTTRSSGC